MVDKEVRGKPPRWQQPFGVPLTDQDVAALLAREPFASMDSDQFPAHCSLADLLRYDTRIVDYQEGDIVVREGDYGHSAFLILAGAVHVCLRRLPDDLLGRAPRESPSWWRSLAQLWSHADYPEVRADPNLHETQAQRQAGTEVRIFLQDVPRILDQYGTARLTEGELFGEVAALARTPRTATLFAENGTRVLEIRWQGLRDLMRRAPAWRDHINQLYRQNSLHVHLRETPWLRHLSIEQIKRIAGSTTFETYGAFEWHQAYQRLAQDPDPARRMDEEPLIAAEGHYANGLILIRAGFARVSRRWGVRERTTAYLGKGHTFGLPELAHAWSQHRSTPLTYSLRGMGYVDILRIPTRLVEEVILPQMPNRQLQQLLQQWIPEYLRSPETVAIPPTSQSGNGPSRDDQRPLSPDPAVRTGISSATELPTGLLEFLGDNYAMNGTQAMLIDLNRCTRCDDCVRACATTHANNPRFVRHGPRFQQVQIAHACMHCVDPVCMIGCPTGAIGRDARQGTVLIHDTTCIGCGVCAGSCPYQNIRMVPIVNAQGASILDPLTNRPMQKATKCDLCSEQPSGPACQMACSHDALRRIDLMDLSQLQGWLQTT